MEEEQEARAIAPLLKTGERYACGDYPISISNPASFDELRALAEDLKAQGLWRPQWVENCHERRIATLSVSGFKASL